MHNLHFVVTSAKSPQEAVNNVENEIEEWGNENNWRSFGGCISEDDEAFIAPDSYSRWTPEGFTIDMINNMVAKWLAPLKHHEEAFIKCSKGDEPEKFDWYSAKKYCESMYQRKVNNIKDGEFDVLNQEFFDWQFNECGVTHIDVSESKNGLKKYVVFVDMHD